MRTESKQWHTHVPHLCTYCLKEDILFQPIMHQQRLKRTSTIKVAIMKITDDFCYACAYHKIDTFRAGQR